MPDTIFTIGHSTHTLGTFAELLERHGITALCDVRSVPYSRMNPQFNRETLQGALAKSGIHYFFLGKELGARPEDTSCYKNHQVQFDVFEKTALFQSGIDKVINISKEYHTALMCAEKDPLSCHRTILVARVLVKNGFTVEHILGDGSIEKHAQAQARLLKQLHLPETDMFKTKDEIIDEAYRKQAGMIAYKED
ncbi:MAG: DUF488 domain-containing protein [Alphaproteobacteria bacterium]|nr:DUF488 domain-containing protein [Alphaproteobacteria bacterium]